jgi:hypothetical protein
MTRFITFVAVSSLALVACKKEESKPASAPAEAGKAKEAPAPARPTGPFAAWDMEGRTKALQGAHVTPGGFAGSWEAWNVEGDKVTIFDGKEEKVLELKVLSPCEVKSTERSADGSSSGTISHFTLKDGAIVKGLGDAGSRKGAEAIACVSNKVFTLDAKGVCTEWEEDMFEDGQYKPAPGTCGWKKDGDKETFVATVNGHETELEVHGDALLSQQLAMTHSEKAADFAAAKAALAGKQ